VAEAIEEKERAEVIFKSRSNLRSLLTGSGKVFIDNE